MGDRIVLNSMDIYEQQNDTPNEISADSGVPEMPESLAEVGYEAPAKGGGAKGKRPGGATGAAAKGSWTGKAGAGGQPAGGRPGGGRPKQAKDS